MTTLVVPKWEFRAIDAARYLRNGRVPDAAFAELLAGESNKVGRWYTKEICRFSVPIASIPANSTAGDRNRWRHRWHSGPLASYARLRALVAFQSTADPLDSKIRWDVTEVGGGTTSVEASFGLSVSGGYGADTPAKIGVLDLKLTLTVGTDYEGLFVDVDKARIVAVCAKEVSLDPDTDNGYVAQGYAQGSPVLDTDRSAAANLLSSEWKEGKAHAHNWSVPVESAPRTRVLVAAINAIDNSSTVVSVNSPGWTLDFRHRNRMKDAGVPCVFAAYAKQSSGSGGRVRLKDSGGTAVATLNINSSTAAWYTTTVNLPTTRAKYDLTLESDGVQTCSLYAASLYQKE